MHPFRTALMVAMALTALGIDTARLHAQAPAAPTLRLDTSDGLLVVLSWTADQTAVSTRLDVGSASGLSDLAVIDLPPFHREFRAFPVPAGTYYVRVRAVNGSALSAPSNEVAVTVAGCPPLPPTPTLEGFTPGQQIVALSWTYSFGTGCAPDFAQVEAGFRSGASDAGVFPVVGFSGVTVRNVPFGNYYTRVRLVRNGVAGHASNEVPVSVSCAPPPALTSARADVVGNAARFSWQYDGGSAANFTVFIEAGTAPGAADIGAIAAPSGANLGFNVSGPAGTYFTRLRAVSECGSRVSAEIPVTLTAACPIPDYVPIVDARLGVGSPLTVTWEAPPTGGLVQSYTVDVGSGPGLSDITSRVVDGRWMPPFGFSQSLGGTFPREVYLRVTPVNGCGAGPTSAEAHANVACIAPPPTLGVATVNARRVSMGWGVGSEFDPTQDFVVEIGRSPFATDVLVTAPLSATYPAGPSFSVDLPPGRYFARARRLYAGCNERSNPSRELTFEVLP